MRNASLNISLDFQFIDSVAFVLKNELVLVVHYLFHQIVYTGKTTVHYSVFSQDSHSAWSTCRRPTSYGTMVAGTNPGVKFICMLAVKNLEWILTGSESLWLCAHNKQAQAQATHAAQAEKQKQTERTIDECLSQKKTAPFSPIISLLSRRKSDRIEEIALSSRYSVPCVVDATSIDSKQRTTVVPCWRGRLTHQSRVVLVYLSYRTIDVLKN